MELARQQEESRRELGERERLVLERLRLEEEEQEEEERSERARKSKEATRFERSGKVLDLRNNTREYSWPAGPPRP